MSSSASSRKSAWGSSSPRATKLPKLGVVAVRVRDRLGEDRRVGGRAGDGELVHEPLELAALEQLPRERVQPDRYSGFVQLL